MFRRNAYLVLGALLLVVLIAGCGGSGGGGSMNTSASSPQALVSPSTSTAQALAGPSASDAKALTPAVSSTIPANGARDVAVYKSISATFNEALNPSTINNSTFTLRQGAKTTLVAGTVKYANQTATFAPTRNLPPAGCPARSCRAPDAA